jgi:pyruvate,orthophosphate dikinase
VSGAGAVKIDYKTRIMTIDGKTYQEGDWISLNGSTGEVYEGRVQTKTRIWARFWKNHETGRQITRMSVRTNADTPHDARVARNFGAQESGFAVPNTCSLKENALKPCAK